MNKFLVIIGLLTLSDAWAGNPSTIERGATEPASMVGNNTYNPEPLSNAANRAHATEAVVPANATPVPTSNNNDNAYVTPLKDYENGGYFGD